MQKRKISIIYHTRFHAIEKITNEIIKGITSVEGVLATAITVEDAVNKTEEINTSDGVIFGSPTYFGSISSEMKAFFDTTTQIWMQKKWGNKIAAGFTHSSSLSGDKVMTLTQMMIFAMQHGMIWTGLDLLPSEQMNVDEMFADLVIDGAKNVELNRLGGWIGLMCQSNSQKGIELPYSDLCTARHFGRRIAKVVACHAKL